MNNQDFFVCLGYLANPQRITRLDVELPERKRRSFEGRYENITGTIPIPDNNNYYVWSDDKNKWGIEMRLYFIQNDNIPDPLRDLAVSSTYGRPEYIQYNARINNNDFIWRLIEHGVRLGNRQDLNRIRNTVPKEFLENFENGFER